MDHGPLRRPRSLLHSSFPLLGVLAFLGAGPMAALGAPCLLDIDGDGLVQSGTDVVYIARHLLGLVPVPPSFRQREPGIPDDQTIAAGVEAARPGLDVDGNGRIETATDVVYVARTLLGLAPVPPSFRTADPTIPADEVIVDAIATCLPAPSTTTTTMPSPLPGLPADVGGFEGWLRLNAQPIPPRPSDPHNGTKLVFVNQARGTIAPGGQQRFPYPDGSIVVKAATRPGRDFIGLFAIMRKRAGQDPAHGDWEFVEYVRSSASEQFFLAARDAVCWNCHAAAASVDWVFTPLD